MAVDNDYPSDDDQSFSSARSRHDDEHAKLQPLRFPPEEEAVCHSLQTHTRNPTNTPQALLDESNTLKTSANSQFAHGAFSEAIQTYDRALSSCPNYLDYEIAVLQSNIAACHLKLSDWKEAIESATKGIDALERIDPLPKPKQGRNDASGTAGQQEAQGSVEEIDDETAEKIEALEKSGHTRDEVQKIRVKAFMRRAKARMETGGWAALQGADEGAYNLPIPFLPQPTTLSIRLSGFMC